MPFRCVLILVLLLPSVVGRATDDWVVDSGLSRDDARVARLLKFLDSAREEAIADARSRLGLVLGKLPVQWRVTARAPDAADASARVAGEFHAGETRVETTRVVVSIPAHRYLERPRKVLRVVVHETVHATLASRAGSFAAYQRIPG